MNTGRRIAHYEIKELLGEGGIGQVHAAYDTVLCRDVAIKSLRPELVNDQTFVERFRTEATNLARLNHPNITTLYALLPEGRNLYMVMELVRGRTLETIIQERGTPFAADEALAIIGQAADGLCYAHAMGVIHRDIKPANLIITDGGLLKIMDFGIARVQGSQRLTRDGSIIGTLAYMAPEQLRAEEVDARTDLYSLAIVLYEMLTGAVPFSAASDYDLMRAQIHTAPERLAGRVSGLAPQIDRAVMRALAKRPDDRYPTVAAFKEALGASLSRTDATTIVQRATRLITTASLPESVRSTMAAMSAPVAAAMTDPQASRIPMWLRGVAVGAAAAVVVAAVFVLLVGAPGSGGSRSAPAAPAVATAPPAAPTPSGGGVQKSAQPAPAATAPAPAANTTASHPLFPSVRRSTASADAPANPAAPAAPAAGAPAAAPGAAPARRPDGTAAPPFQVAAEPTVARPAAQVAEATAASAAKPAPAAVPPAVPPQRLAGPEQRPVSSEPQQAAALADDKPLVDPRAPAAPEQVAEQSATAAIAPAQSNLDPAPQAAEPDARAAPARRVAYADVKAAYDLKDYPRTRELAEPLAGGGDADAQFIMGRLHHIGGGMRKDEEAAVAWYQKAADQGHALAQYALGIMYENGDGVLANKRTAAEWYRRSASRGVPGAQFNLGVMFARGEGVERDLTQAKRWFTEAAGSSDAFIAEKASQALDQLSGRRRRR